MARVTRSQTATTQVTSSGSAERVSPSHVPPTKKSKSRAKTSETEDAPSRPAKKSKKAPSTASSTAPAVISSDGVHSFEIPSEKKPVPCELHGGPVNTTPSLLFTHGAGGGISTPATQDFAKGFATTSPVLLYQGTMNLPNRVKACQTVIDHVSWCGALGGRSMGARAACIAAAGNEGTEAVVLVSYPLIGGKEGNDMRDQILLDLPERVDVLFMSGDKDSMCPLNELEGVRAKMKARSWLAVVDGADHGMSVSPKKASEAVRERTGVLAAAWLKERDAKRTECTISWDAEADEVKVTKWA